MVNEEEGKWNAELCDCCEVMPLCIISLICPCVTQGITAWENSTQEITAWDNSTQRIKVRENSAQGLTEVENLTLGHIDRGISTQGTTAQETPKINSGCGECLISCCCCCLGMSLNRERFASGFKIKPSFTKDCILFYLCCYSCMVTQEYLHTIKKKKRKQNLK